MDRDGGSEIGVVGSINLCNGGSSRALDDLTDQVHQLPCCIKYDGPCTVSHYFKPKPTEMEMDGLKVQESYFRGRKLQGATIPLPHGYSGFVLGKKSNDKSNSCDKSEETQIVGR